MNTLDLQVALFRLGFDPGLIDGTDGPKTQAAVSAFLAGREPVGLESYLGDELSKLPQFIQAKNFNRDHRPFTHPLDFIVIHTAEAPEIHKEALNVAGWFAQQPADGTLVNGAKFGGSSAHWVVDDCEIVQCVLECDRAWHVGALDANARSIGIEHAGFASQSPADWADEYSTAVLERSAYLVAKLCVRFSIPMQKLTYRELAAGGRGIVGHIDCTNAFSGGRGHVDPGPSFPWDRYIELVRAAAIAG